MFNYNVEAKEYKKFSSGNINFELPVYGDLLGEEYDVIENLDRSELQWNQRLIAVTEQIAQSKGMGLWEVSKLLTTAETATPQDRYDLLGDHLTDFTAILAERPSESRRIYAIALAMLRRTDPDIREETIKKFPRRLLQEIVDFAVSEQQSAEHIPYTDLIARYEMLLGENELMKEVVKAAAAVKNKPKALDNALSNYITKVDNLGKYDMQSE